jgi:hypothetical protein
LVDFDFLAINQQGVIRFGEITANRPAIPIVFGRHWARTLPHVVGQRGPDQDHVQVAGMVGKIHALAGVWLTIDPAHASPAQESR